MVLSRLVLILCLGNLFQQNDCKVSVASEAIVNLLETQFSDTWQSKVDLIHFGGSKKVFNEILHHLPADISIKVVDGADNSSVKNRNLPRAPLAYSRDSEDVKFMPWNNVLRRASVLLFGSVQQFKNYIADITWLGNRWFRYKHIVYAPNLTASDVMETSKNGFEIDAVAFLMNETTRSIDLVSSYMFTPRGCRYNQLETINRYNAQVSKWNTSDFYPPKYKNFFNCTLTFVDKPDARPNDKKAHIIANVPASNYVPSKLDLPYEKHNARTTDLINGMNVMIGGFLSMEIYATATMLSNIVLYLPIGEPFSLLEKMFMMFDGDVWIAIGCTLLFWFISIRIFNLMPQKIRDLVYGRSIRTPTMNLLDIFLNGGQHKVPTNKLAKYLLMLFVFWSLIIRTCYQSMLFEYLQSDLRMSYHLNLTDILTHKTKFTAIPGFRVAGRSVEEITSSVDIVAEYSNLKYATVTDSVVNDIESYYRTGKNSLKIHEENIVTFSMMPTFFEFSPYFQEFNDRIGRLIAGGFYGNRKLNDPGKKQFVEDIGPQVLTFEQLRFGFIACLIPLIIAIVVFILEVTVQAASTLIIRISIYFAIIVYQQRVVIGQEKEIEDDEKDERESLDNEENTSLA